MAYVTDQISADLYLYSAWRKPERQNQDLSEYYGSLSCQRYLARGELDFCTLGCAAWNIKLSEPDVSKDMEQAWRSNEMGCDVYDGECALDTFQGPGYSIRKAVSFEAGQSFRLCHPRGAVCMLSADGTDLFRKTAGAELSAGAGDGVAFVAVFAGSFLCRAKLPQSERKGISADGWQRSGRSGLYGVVGDVAGWDFCIFVF